MFQNYFRRVAVIAGVILCTLLAIEGMFRFAQRHKTREDIVVVDPNTRVRHLQPNLDMYVDGGTGLLSHIVTNEDGFASPSYTTSTPPRTKRIMFLGNSFTQGFEVDYDKKFTSRVETALLAWSKERGGPQYQVFNFGIGGASIVEQFFLYREYVRKYDPDVVVLVSYVGYDFSTNRRYLGERSYILDTPLQELSVDRVLQGEQVFEQRQQTWKTRLVTHVYILRHLIKLVQSNATLYEIAIRLGILHRPLTADVGNYFSDLWPYLNPTSAPHREIMEFTGDIIHRFSQIVSQDNAQFVLITIPSYWQVHQTYVDQLQVKKEPLDLLLPNSILLQKSRNDFLIHDLSAPIARAINEDHMPVFVHDVGHFTAQGHVLAAEEIISFLKAHAQVLGL